MYSQQYSVSKLPKRTGNGCAFDECSLPARYARYEKADDTKSGQTLFHGYQWADVLENNLDQSISLACVPRAFHSNEYKNIHEPMRINAIDHQEIIIAEKELQKIQSRNQRKANHDDSSGDEFFEAEDGWSNEAIASPGVYSLLDSGSSVFNVSSLPEEDFEVRPQMTCPLAPNNTKLDFSLILSQRGLTNIYTATPLARVWEFNTSPKEEECSILNILADEFEKRRYRSPPRKTSIWKTMKHFTFGATADEFDTMYPWAKYSMKNENDLEE